MAEKSAHILLIYRLIQEEEFSKLKHQIRESALKDKAHPEDESAFGGLLEEWAERILQHVCFGEKLTFPFDEILDDPILIH